MLVVPWTPSERRLRELLCAGRDRENRPQAFFVDLPDRVDPVINEHHGDLLGVGLEQRRIIQNGPLFELDGRELGENGRDDDARIVAQVAPGLAEKGQSRHAFRL